MRPIRSQCRRNGAPLHAAQKTLAQVNVISIDHPVPYICFSSPVTNPVERRCNTELNTETVESSNEGFLYLVAEFISPPKVYTFSFIVGNIFPQSVKCKVYPLSY